jgi:hypothetical protein
VARRYAAGEGGCPVTENKLKTDRNSTTRSQNSSDSQLGLDRRQDDSIRVVVVSSSNWCLPEFSSHNKFQVNILVVRWLKIEKPTASKILNKK